MSEDKNGFSSLELFYFPFQSSRTVDDVGHLITVVTLQTGRWMEAHLLEREVINGVSLSGQIVQQEKINI